jgi:hypothetical protein
MTHRTHRAVPNGQAQRHRRVDWKPGRYGGGMDGADWPLWRILRVFTLLGATIVASIVQAAPVPVPTFDVEPSCRAAASAGGSSADLSVCLREEQQARAQFVRLWPEFTAAETARCLPLSTLGGQPTYTELLTCLELVRDASKLRSKSGPVATTGQRRR